MPSPTEIEAEWARCKADPCYFIDTYCKIYDGQAGDWIPFRLWPAQVTTLDTVANNRLSIILKARQLGITWLVLAYALWLMIFWPAVTILLFSRREIESIYLLSKERLRGMYDHLPEWLRVPSIEPDASKVWMLANGSVCRAFPTNAGDSYTASLVIVDEADLISDKGADGPDGAMKASSRSLGRLIRSAKPTIDGGGQMILLSKANKAAPESEFKRIYRAAKVRKATWVHVFLPWHVHPDRSREWYQQQASDILTRTGSLDELHEQYPVSDAEALAPRTLDKRIAPAWLQQCFVEQERMDLVKLAREQPRLPAIPSLEIYRLPQPARRYVIGADPAEGNPTSDDSAAEVTDVVTGEQVAALAGKFQPQVFAAHIASLSAFYNNAAAMVERNNHGHAVLLWLADNSKVKRLTGHDGNVGWLSNSKGKALLYDHCAEAFREHDAVLHAPATFWQLESIEGTSLRAPEGQHDDRADALALALQGSIRGTGGSPPGVAVAGQGRPFTSM